MINIKRFFPLILLILLIGLAYYLGLGQQVSWQRIREEHSLLKEAAEENFMLASLTFILVYMLYTFLCLPGVLFLSVLAGYLFSQPLSTLYVVIADTIGCSVIFLATRTAIGDLLKRKASSFLSFIEHHFSKNETFYLFAIRLIPLFPLWVVSAAFGFFKVRFTSFLWTTFLGVMPAAFFYTQIGSGLVTVLNQNESITWEILFIPQIALSLMGLAALCVLPFCLNRFKS